MPLVRINHAAGRTRDHGQAISDGVHRAMVETFNVPEDDRFQVITETSGATRIAHAPSYLGTEYTDDLVLIQITCNEGRTVEQKRRLYAATADNLHQEAGLRRQDVIINLVEVRRENWSFGDGIAQYAAAEAEALPSSHG